MGHVLTCRWLLRFFIQIYGGIIASKSVEATFQSGICRVRVGKEAMGSLCTLDRSDTNDHTGSRQQTVAGASGAT